VRSWKVWGRIGMGSRGGVERRELNHRSAEELKTEMRNLHEKVIEERHEV